MPTTLKVNIIRCQFLPDLEKKGQETFLLKSYLTIKILFRKNKAYSAYALLKIGSCQSLNDVILQHQCKLDQ